MLQDLLKDAHSRNFKKLIELFKGGILPHALLFSGPLGVGKKALAQELASLIIQSGAPFYSGADLHELSPETAMGNYSMDQIRHLQQICSRAPYEGRYRVFIIDEAQRLGVQPSNAFLKLLEEPPENHFFILISSCSYKLLPTLLSRLQKFEFSALSSPNFSKWLEVEKLDIQGFESLAQGSMTKAYAVAKYKKYLEGFQKLLPRSYFEDLTAYRSLLEALDDDEDFNFAEFYPLFQDLLLDYYHAASGYKPPHLSWALSSMSGGLRSLMSYSSALKELEKASQSNLKVSSCFERFFMSP